MTATDDPTVIALGCTSTLHDRTNCDKAFTNSEIEPDEFCPSCLAKTEGP